MRRGWGISRQNIWLLLELLLIKSHNKVKKIFQIFMLTKFFQNPKIVWIFFEFLCAGVGTDTQILKLL